MRKPQTIKELRFFSGLTQIDIAQRTRVHQGRLTLIERGLSPPRDWEKKALAEFFDRNINEIDWNGWRNKRGEEQNDEI